MRSLPDLGQWWDNVTWSGCEIWFLVRSGSGLCGQGHQTCLCQLGLPVWGVHSAECDSSLVPSQELPRDSSAAQRGEGGSRQRGHSTPLFRGCRWQPAPCEMLFS